MISFARRARASRIRVRRADLACSDGDGEVASWDGDGDAARSESEDEGLEEAVVIDVSDCPSSDSSSELSPDRLSSSA